MKRGAFTGAASAGKIGKIELANHGTLFLDEIGELPPHIQSKLLQLIREKTIERVSGTKRIELISVCWWPLTAIWRRRCSGGCSVRTFSTG